VYDSQYVMKVDCCYVVCVCSLFRFVECFFVLYVCSVLLNPKNCDVFKLKSLY
jgi:hypothetical protein